MKKIIYRHMISSDHRDSFSLSVFKPVKNRASYDYCNKPEPHTGLWASPVKCERSWADWCKNEMPDWYTGRFFYFTLAKKAKVLKLCTKRDLVLLHRTHPEWIFKDKSSLLDSYYFDFDRMIADGVDAIEVKISELYYELYGWDCDSILIMNPKIVRPI